jgi:Thermolysin metallopeptidase, alpha-helical domain/Thermolysin metallopeptidase, catalytic domain
MKHQHACHSEKCICHVIPPYMLEAIARNGTEAMRQMALRTLGQDRQLRAMRTTQLQSRIPRAGTQEAVAPNKNRLIYNANNLTVLPGTLVLSEGQGTSSDVSVDEAYKGFGATFDLFWDAYKRNSIDANGMDMVATVHYDYNYNNAFWDGSQMVFGDGDGTIFNRFTIAIDIMGHELAHGVTQYTSGLEYHDQPGALNESVSDVFGSLVKQRSLNQTADQADWLIGAGLLAAGISGVALRSMKAPGTAYDDYLLGKDPQPDHMDRYVNTTDDNGGVHINSGIPNKAFYLAAVAIGGYAWETAGNIWYQTLIDPRLTATAQFQDFANLTVDNAGKFYDESIRAKVAKAWQDVGVKVKVSDAPSAKQLLVAKSLDGRLEMFYIGLDDAIYHNWQLTPGGNWSGYEAFGDSAKQLIVAQNQDGRLELFCIKLDDTIFHNVQTTTDGKWEGWKPFNGKPHQLTVAQKMDKQPETLYE